MTTEQYNTDQAARDLREWMRMRDELDELIDDMKAAIQQYMYENNKDELHGVESVITWKPVKTRAFESRRFKEEHPDLAAQYTKEVTTRRFLVK